MPDQLSVKCPSCDRDLHAADEDGLVPTLQQHLYEKHGLEMPRERIRENVAAQLRDFDGYKARPISGA
jgi:predicted small metal-binding protein